jgi:hypothetical protein
LAIIDISYLRDGPSGTNTGQVLFDAQGYPIYNDAINLAAGANTYLQLQNRVQNEVLGSPTQSDIQNAIQDAIEEYQRESFDFNRIRYFGDVTGSGSDLQTVQGQEFYSSVDLPVLINYPHITKILVLAFQNRYPLIQRTPQWIDDQSLSTTWQGWPTDWAWDSGSLRLYPVPNNSYPLILDATIRYRPLSNPSDYSVWTNRAEALIRLEAKRLLFKNIIRDQAQADAMELEVMGDPRTGRQGALAMLRREATRRAGGTGKLRPSRGFF